jgi:RNA polymerase sigma-70 factor (ECF subfamily)
LNRPAPSEAAPPEAPATGQETSESGLFTRLALPESEAQAGRANALVRDNLRFIWRLLRRLGLAPSDADDATQRVFVAAVRHIERIHPGSERAFLFRTAVRIAHKVHASSKRRREAEAADALDAVADSAPSPEELSDRHRARQLLDQVLELMPLELRTAFILFELERLTTTEVAEVLGIPRGTAASRLRRARADFNERVHRIEARIKFREGER